MHTATRTAVLLVLLAVVLGAAPTHAETVNCIPLTTLPAIITVQGIYCFTGDLTTAITAGLAIDIQTNNVVLDFEDLLHRFGATVAETAAKWAQGLAGP